jgi:transposase
MWLTTKEAAKELGISVSTLKRRISKGIYPTQYEMIYKNGAGVKILKIYVEKSEVQSEVQSEVHTNKSEVQSEVQSEVHTNKSEVQSEVHTNKSEVQSEVHTNKSEVQSEVQKQSSQIQPLTLPPILSDYGPDFFIKRTSGSMRDKLIETYLNLSRDEKSQVLNYIRQFMSERTWYSWVSRYRNRGHLKRKVRADRGKSRKELPTFMQELLQAILISHPQWNVQKAYEDMKLLAVNGELMDPETGEVYEDVSEYLVREWIKTSIVRDRWYFRWYPKRKRNLYTSMSHARGINPPNTVWMIDDHDQDVLVWGKDDDGKDRQIRPKVIRSLDPETNMIMGWCMTDKTYGSIEIKTAIIDGIIKHRCIPKQIYLECDKRMRESGLIEGLEKLGIEVIGTPYNPTAKVNVERSFGNDRMELDSKYDSYINHNTVERPDDADRRVFTNYEEYFQDYADYVEHWNTQRPSIFRGKIKMTPVDMWNAWIKRGWKPEMLPMSVIDHIPYWFGKKEVRVVQGGRVRFTIDGEQFYYLGECLMQLPNGTPVDIRRKFNDPREGYVYIGNENLGKIFLQEKIGYGFLEFSQPEAVRMVQGFNLMRTKLLKVNDEDYPFIKSYLNRIEELSKSQIKDATMLIPNKIIRFINEKTGSALEVSEKMRQEEVSVLKVKSGLTRKMDSKVNDLDDEISALLGGSGE